MNSLHFSHYPFVDIPRLILYQALKLRSDVFVVEQACIYPDLDHKDTHIAAIHLVVEQENTDGISEVVAYSRCLPPGVSYPQASIGRVAVREDKRGLGVAKQLMRESVHLCARQWPRSGIQIGAQLYLQQFYEKLGFQPVGKAYDEDGIMHIDMQLQGKHS